MQIEYDTFSYGLFFSMRLAFRSLESESQSFMVAIDMSVQSSKQYLHRCMKGGQTATLKDSIRINYPAMPVYALMLHRPEHQLRKCSVRPPNAFAMPQATSKFRYKNPPIPLLKHSFRYLYMLLTTHLSAATPSTAPSNPPPNFVRVSAVPQTNSTIDSSPLLRSLPFCLEVPTNSSIP